VSVLFYTRVAPSLPTPQLPYPFECQNLTLIKVTPDANRIAVFSRGICKGLNGKIPVGGHVDPSSIEYNIEDDVEVKFTFK
jgi:hypothetical protein